MPINAQLPPMAEPPTHPTDFPGGEPSASKGDGNDLPLVNSLDLLGPRKAIAIEHNGRRYVLRETRHGKLILNA